jgi:hypothetical protein
MNQSPSASEWFRVVFWNLRNHSLGLGMTG